MPIRMVKDENGKKSPKNMLDISGGGNTPQHFTATTNSLFAAGGKFDEKVDDRAQVFEPLADNIKNPMPAASLAQYAPESLNQGSKGSCVGWASAYAALSGIKMSNGSFTSGSAIGYTGNLRTHSTVSLLMQIDKK